VCAEILRAGVCESQLIFKSEPEERNVNRVVQFIQENPGCHLRLIKRELEVSIGTVQYHLAKLEKMGKITTNRYDLYKYYFPMGVLEEKQKDLLQVLSQETPREILMVIVEQKNPTQKDIVNRIGISYPAVNWHIRHLLDLKIIGEIREGKYKRYQLRSNPRYVMALLRRYYPNIFEKWSSRFVDLFLSIYNSDEK
jgi:predicted transcriptional regulator